MAFRHGRARSLVRERLELPDGDFLHLDRPPDSCSGSALVVILPGMGGSSRSHYVSRLLHALTVAGLESVVLNARGCSGTVNRLARGHHAGETGDLAFVVGSLRDRDPHRPIFAVGYSLGGNVVLKWLGESGPECPLSGAVAVSVPFGLARSVLRLNRGLGRLYQRHLLKEARRTVLRKQAMHSGLPFTGPELCRMRTLREFDERVTAPLHGFRNADHYYADSDVASGLREITKPTLILQARDDPLVDPGALPDEDTLSASVRLELSEGGGHVGFIAGSIPLRPVYWLDERILSWLRSQDIALDP